MFAKSVFNIPKRLCKARTDAMVEFWWGDIAIIKCMHWMAWWRIRIPKKYGGMGFRDLHSFSLAMLAK